MPASDFFGCVQSGDQKGNLVTELRVPRGFTVGSGNNIAVFVSFGTTARVCTVTDDKGGTYIRRVNVVRGQRFQVWTRTNVTDAPRIIIAQFDSTGSGYVAVSWGEACGVGAFDVAAGTTGTSLTPNSGSLTPAAGALVVFGAVQDSSATFLTSWTPDAGYATSWAELILTFQYGQWRLHTSGATTPGVTMSASRGWCGGAVSFVANTALGTAPSTLVPLIHKMNHNSFVGTSVQTVTPYKMQGPSAGCTRIAILFEDCPGVDITSITDTDGNTWTKHADIPGGGGGGVNEFWSAPVLGAGSSTNIITANFTGASVDCFNTFMAFKNDGGIDAAVTTTATALNAVTSTQAGTTTTPSTITGLLIGLMGVQSNTVISVDIGNFIACLSTPTVASPAPLMQNNGYVIQYPTAITPIQRIWTLDGAPANWQELNVFILNGTTPPPTPPAGPFLTATTLSRHGRRRRVGAGPVSV